MDYIDFHIRRIADDLQRAGVPIPGQIHKPVTSDEPQQHTPTTSDEPRQGTAFTIAKGHKSVIYLPSWIQKHRDDPALTVEHLYSLFAQNTH